VGTHNIIYAYTDGYQCSSSDTVSIQVFMPTPISIISGLNTQNCKNDSAYKLIISPTGGSYGVSYIINDTFYPNLAPTGKMGYIYVYTDAHNCISALDDSAYVFNNPTVNAGTDTLLPCGSNGVVIGENPQANHSYIWSPAAGLNNPFIGNPTANPWVDTTVFVVVKTNSNTLCKGYDSVMITIPNPPVVSISGDTSICMGDTVHLVASGAPNYVWKYGITTPNFDTLLPISQYITVTGTDANNCIGKDSVIVLVNPLPVPNLGNDTTIFMDSIVLNPGFFSSYLWNTGDITQTIVVNSNLTPGFYSYSVSVQNQFGCSANDSIIINITTDIQSISRTLLLKAYPNPTSDWLNISLNEPAYIDNYSVYDNQGRLVQQLVIKAVKHDLRINLSKFVKGKYYIQLSIEGKIQTLPIFVQ
jgi:hypothetical protein